MNQRYYIHITFQMIIHFDNFLSKNKNFCKIKTFQVLYTYIGYVYRKKRENLYISRGPYLNFAEFADIFRSL